MLYSYGIDPNETNKIGASYCTWIWQRIGKPEEDCSFLDHLQDVWQYGLCQVIVYLGVVFVPL